MKRLLDILLTLPSLLVFAPLGLVIALALKFAGEGNIFFLQCRIGRDFRPFIMLKFCTMLGGSAAGFPLTVRQDPRVFPLGRILRATKLNEVPQLLNVLIGQMTIVGPRPMLERELQYNPDAKNETILSMSPGLTSLASIAFRDEERFLSASPDRETCYRDHIAPLKADLDVWYVKHQSLWLDLRLMALTAWQILFPASRAYLRVLGQDAPLFSRRIDSLFGRIPEVSTNA